MNDLIFVSLENWDEIWRRNQFLCAAYARRYPQCKILFVGLARDASSHLRNRTLSQLWEEATWTVPGLPNITITRPLKLLPNTLAAGRKWNAAAARLHIRRIGQRLGLNAPILWLNPHDAVHMAGHMNESAILYDITDDWISPTQSSALSARIAAQDAALCRRADAVIVCSQRLWEMKQTLARRLYLIPNGVDADHYHTVLGDREDLPDEAKHWSRPVLGYTGTLHPDRIDVTLIADISARLRHGSLVLIGPNNLPTDVEAMLRRLPNVFLPGAVPYARVPDYMRAFDVCITPHRVTRFTESLNPIKLWEYLAAGKPIVSTNVAGFRDYPHFVRIAVGADHFVSAVEEALQEDPAIAHARRAEARHHSWEARLDAVEAVIAASIRVSASSTTVKGTVHAR